MKIFSFIITFSRIKPERKMFSRNHKSFNSGHLNILFLSAKQSISVDIAKSFFYFALLILEHILLLGLLTGYACVNCCKGIDSATFEKRPLTTRFKFSSKTERKVRSVECGSNESSSHILDQQKEDGPSNSSFRICNHIWINSRCTVLYYLTILYNEKLFPKVWKMGKN